MPLKDKEERVLLFTSTEHATTRQADGSQWTVNIGNTTYAEKVDAIAPLEVNLANLFNNVTQYNNTFNVTNLDGLVVVVIPVGYYTASSFAAAASAQLVGIDVVMAVSAGGYFRFSSISGTHGLTVVTSLSVGWWELIGGFVDPQVDLSLSILTILQGTSFTMNHPPNMAGEKLVHIACDKIAHGNLVHGADGKLHDILVTVPLHNTAYGNNTTFVPQEEDHYLIDYRYTNSLSSTLDFQLLDSKMRPLSYPANHHIMILFKLHHHENHAT